LISPRPRQDLALDLTLPSLPAASLQGGDPSPLTALQDPARGAVVLGDLLDGTVDGVVTSACRIPEAPGELLIQRTVGLGDRRDVVLGAEHPLSRLTAGAEVVAPDLRSVALLRAHHPELVPLRRNAGTAKVCRDGASAEAPPEIRPLWPDPTVESAGELLEPDSWLPAPGQGVAVLVYAPEAGHRFRDVILDPGADAVLRAERAVGRAFPFAVPLVRAQLFGEWLSVHGVVLAPTADRAVRARVRGDRADPVGVGERLVELLVARGADLLRPPEWTDRVPRTVAP